MQEDGNTERDGTGAGRFGSPEQIVANLAFIALLVAVVWGVVSRHVVTTPSAWVEEVSAFAYCWLIFVGAAEVHRRAQHVGVDVVTALLPAPVRAGLAMLIEILVVLMSAYIAWLGLRQAIVSHSSTTSMLRLPLSIGYAGLTLGFVLIGVRGAQRIVLTALGRAAR